MGLGAAHLKTLWPQRALNMAHKTGKIGTGRNPQWKLAPALLPNLYPQCMCSLGMSHGPKVTATTKTGGVAPTGDPGNCIPTLIESRGYGTWMHLL